MTTLEAWQEAARDLMSARKAVDEFRQGLDGALDALACGEDSLECHSAASAVAWWEEQLGWFETELENAMAYEAKLREAYFRNHPP